MFMKNLIYFFLFIVPVFGIHVLKAQVNLSIDATQIKHTISPYLNGAHFVYGAENDKLYEDERIADWMRRSKVKTIRWPGGTAVMTYHWDDLTGDNFGPDKWDTLNYVEKNIPPTAYMDLDEYIAYCRRINADPMVGVNIKSGKQFRTDAEGLDEARRLIQYCKDKNYNVKFWYLGNEGYAKGFSPVVYAKYIDMYAEVLKQVDPDITIIGDWKFGPEVKKRFEESMTIIKLSKHLDIMEYHEKWGNEWGLAGGRTLEEWKNEFPLYNGKFDDYCTEFFKQVKAMGKETKLGFNEWGVGGNLGGTPHNYALLVADYMLMMMRHDVFLSCYWNMNMGQGSKDNRVFTTKSNEAQLEKMNPVAKVFELTASALGAKYLEVKSSDKQVYGVAALAENNKELQLYLLNKSPETQSVQLNIDGVKVKGKVAITCFDETGKELQNTLDNKNGKFELSAYSFSKLIFNL
jgi:alpha-L-arabinofuranosidase